MSDDEFKQASASDNDNPKLELPKSPNKRERSSDRLSALKRQRGATKLRITLFQKYFSRLPINVLSDTEMAELRLRVQELEDLLRAFNTVQCEIEAKIDEKELSSQLEYREQFEELYFSILATAKCRLVAKSAEVNSPCTAHKSVSIKLPDIKLPSFNGSYDQWLEFKNSYITMIHKRDDLDAIQKFHYLRSSLSDTALQVISALEFTAANYTHAWDLLVNRFHNNRLLIHNHVKSLFTLQPIQQESPAQIRKLIDTVNRNLRALKTIGEPTHSWDTLIIYLIVTKLDSSTEREWENHKGSSNSEDKRGDLSLKLDDLLLFLKNRADTLEMIHVSSKRNNQSVKSTHVHEGKSFNNNSNKNLNKSQHVHSYATTQNNKRLEKQIRICAMCDDKHALYTCVRFLNLPVRDRIKFVENKKLCSNCLRSGHSISDCTFGACRQCQQRHNGLLHLDNSLVTPSAENSHNILTVSNNHPSTSAAFHSKCDLNSTEIIGDNSVQIKSSGLQPVLLSTAVIEIADANNKYHRARALLDSGSQHCFITDKLCKRLNLPLIQSTIRISGVGKTVTNSNQLCEIKFRSRSCDYKTQVRCLILPCITSILPTEHIDLNTLCLPSNITVSLADPTFNVPSDIDVLIGADKFWELLDGERIRLSCGPYLQSSKLGWLISGSIGEIRVKNEVQCNFNQTLDSDSLDIRMRKFWELEEVPKIIVKPLTTDELKCEEIFRTTTVRDKNGRFCVRLPLKETADSLGDSYNLAETRFKTLERKFERLPLYKKLYSDFLHEYIELGHMTRIEAFDSPYFVFTHHGVLRESTTTRLRVVFNGSVKTSTNKSLNDIQYTGPILQNDIFSILLRFRQYKYVACADVEKMFRQILVQSDQRNLQLILWRDDPSHKLDIYQLNTVTYGTSSAPYLSMRCLRELARCCDNSEVSKIITEDFYVDDLITGFDDPEILLSTCEKISQVLDSGCFPLRKWTFNYDVTSIDSKELCLDEHKQNKTLGLGWLCNSDELHFTTKIEKTSNLTKRVMLSVISQIYDPLGLLAPAVIISKIMIQKLWLCKIGWDDPVPKDVISTWNTFIQTLDSLQNIRVPRFVRSEHTQHTELHIFTDASQVAFGTCAYVRTYDNNSLVSVKLLCAKSKVAPLKAVSIPRLELCGALTGARLYNKIVQSLRLKFDRVYFWTDSTIVMGWLRMSPHLLKQFVQNRVTEINELTGDSVWLHVNGKTNPADLLTRGLELNALSKSHLWWYGPLFLQNKCENLIQNSSIYEKRELPELKSQAVALTTVDYSTFDFDKYSSFHKLKRIFAYLLRFITNARAQRKQPRLTGSLSVDELRASECTLTIIAQKQMFSHLYSALEKNLPVPVKRNCRISGLNVFFDENKVIRVGGRLSNASEFSYSKKHPILLCSKHRFTLLLFRDEHKRLLHAGPQLLLSTLRECWWPIGGRNLARKIVRQCVPCTRMKGNTLSPIMGNLPAERLRPGYPFMYCGVDYAGPVSILNRKGRGSALVKGYICLFVCFVTRAVHLELVSSLSTNDYILALKRFIARRGKPLEIHSDNGKNLVGAQKEFCSSLVKNSKEIIDFASNESIKFRFILPYSPHTGGIWESGIRNCKHHLRRIVGNARLTFEEFTTVLTSIEAVLNSRPMSPLSTDPDDLTPLTPAHFLIGRPLTAPACEDLTEAVPHRLLRHDRVEQMRQHFWRRWSNEYVSEMQTRTKWKANTTSLQENMLVLVKEDNLPPLKWRLGRIVRTYPGKDGVSRAAEIRTATGTIQRSFAKICPLPVQAPDDVDVPSNV